MKKSALVRMTAVLILMMGTSLGVAWADGSALSGALTQGNASDESSMTGDEALARARKAFDDASLGDPMKWYRLAAEKGNAEAQFYVGTQLFAGMSLGTMAKGENQYDPTQCKEAVGWIRKAADQEYPAAMNWMGNYYTNDPCGLGIKDADKAQAWKEKFEKSPKELTPTPAAEPAAQAPPPNKKRALAYYRWAMDTNKDVKGKAGAEKLYLAAEGGAPEAQYTLGNVILTYVSASELYLAFNQENYKQLPFEKDYPIQEGFYWVQQAAKNGYAQAQFDMGEYCRIGTYGQKDTEQAKAWYRKAADQGNEKAKEALSQLK